MRHCRLKTLFSLLLIFVLPGLLTCAGDEKSTYAKRITSPDELIGGPGALGAVGDWVIGNENFRVIIQDQGWSRGFGIFGGGIIDADVVRAGSSGSSAKGNGKDNFGEFFPAFFLQAFDVQDSFLGDGIEVLSDPSEPDASIIRTRASGGDFITLVTQLLDVAIPQLGLVYETDYIIRPGTRHLEIKGRLLNVTNKTLDLSAAALTGLLSFAGVTDLDLPLGDVALFGKGNQIFAPGAVYREGQDDKPIGFDLRFALEDAYNVSRALPALPGLVVDFLATAGPGVSYGYAAGESERNFIWKNRSEYDNNPHANISQHAMLIPFLMTAFAGAFYELPPASLGPGETFEYSKYFLIGDGDVASIRDELYRVRGIGVGTFEGEIVNAQSGKAESEAWVHIFDSLGHPYSQVQTNKEGRFKCDLAPGDYSYRISAHGRRPFPEESVSTSFNLAAGKSRYRRIRLPSAAEVAVHVRDASGKPLPAKVTIVSTYGSEHDGKKPRDFLFNASLGEHRRFTDLTWRTSSPSRAYIEEVFFAADGTGVGELRPSACTGEGEDESCQTYSVLVSRGPEYDLFRVDGVVLREGERQAFEVILTRTVNTDHYLSADFHVHSRNSIDSFISLEDRVVSAAVEGLELAVATDHNAVTDFAPAIVNMGLGDWLNSMVGVELSTLEMGHFNGFPIKYDTDAASHFPYKETCFEDNAAKVNQTAFDWVECAPGQLFNQLRALGKHGGDKTIIQINHPRDTIMGYFNQFYMNPYTGRVEEPDDRNYPFVDLLYPHNDQTEQWAIDKFSFDFDAIEVFNGKRIDSLHAFKMSEDASEEVVATQQDVCEGGHPENGAGKVHLAEGGHISYPGVIDDWFNLLNRGYTFTATGNSDSHGRDAEMGVPRTYVYVEPNADQSPRDTHPQGVHELDIVDALQKHRAIVTNGPFVDMYVLTAEAPTCSDGEVGLCSDGSASTCDKTGAVLCGDESDAYCFGSIIDVPQCVYGGRIPWGIGETVLYGSSNADQAVSVQVTIRTPAWLNVDELLVYGNGEVIDTITIPTGNMPDGTQLDDELSYEREYAFTEDTWLVVEVKGSQNMFPLVKPKEEPPTNLSQALGGIASGLNLNLNSGGGDGTTAPDYIQAVTPYAITNPIWLDINASGSFDAPGTSAGAAPAPEVTCLKAADAQTKPTVSPVSKMLFETPTHGRHYKSWDIRKIFHGHHEH